MAVQTKGSISYHSEWETYSVIGIVGSRRRDSVEDFRLVEAAFKGVCDQYKLSIGTFILCSGGCPKGADKFAEDIAKKHGIPILIHYPQWGKYGKRAGFMRNTEIARDADILIACVSNDRKGGTEDTIRKFGDKGPLIFV